MLSRMVVGLHRIWHGHLRLPGSGLLLRSASKWLPGLQTYPLRISDIGTLRVDLRDYAGQLWLSHLVGDTLAPYDTEEGLSTAIATSKGIELYRRGTSIVSPGSRRLSGLPSKG